MSCSPSGLGSFSCHMSLRSLIRYLGFFFFSFLSYLTLTILKNTFLLFSIWVYLILPKIRFRLCILGWNSYIDGDTSSGNHNQRHMRSDCSSLWKLILIMRLKCCPVFLLYIVFIYAPTKHFMGRLIEMKWIAYSSSRLTTLDLASADDSCLNWTWLYD